MPPEPKSSHFWPLLGSPGVPQFWLIGRLSKNASVSSLIQPIVVGLGVVKSCITSCNWRTSVDCRGSIASLGIPSIHTYEQRHLQPVVVVRASLPEDETRFFAGVLILTQQTTRIKLKNSSRNCSPAEERFGSIFKRKSCLTNCCLNKLSH